MIAYLNTRVNERINDLSQLRLRAWPFNEPHQRLLQQYRRYLFLNILRNGLLEIVSPVYQITQSNLRKDKYALQQM